MLAKTIHTTQCAISHGVDWDLIRQTAGMPDKAFNSFKRFLILIIRFRICSGRALESATGKIMHWAQFNPSTKVLVYNSIVYIHNNIRNGNIRKSDYLIVPLSIINAFKYWVKYADYVRSVPISWILNTVVYQTSKVQNPCKFG